MNLCVLIGVCFSEPRLEHSAQGRAICEFRLQTFAGRYDNGPDRYEIHEIVTFGAEATYCAEHVTRGLTVHVEGKLRYRRRGVEIVCNQLRLLEPAKREKINSALETNVNK